MKEAMMIRSNYSVNVTPQFRVLSDAQIQEIHLATLEVLRRTGVVVKEPEGLELLRGAGCWVDGQRVRIPAHLLEWAMRTTPSRVVLCDRNGNAAMYLEANKVYYGTGSDTPNHLDPYTGERRPARLQDVANIGRVVDYLANIDFMMCMGIASDVNGAISDLYHFRAMTENTSKPLVFTAWNLNNLKDIIAMAEAVAGGEEALQRNPFCALYTEPISPLQHTVEGTQKLLYMAGKGLPCVYTPGAMTGASAPVTSAGGLVQVNAELLSGFLMAQLKREGTPLIYGGGVLPIDMSTTLMSYASPEWMINTCALTEMARWYKVPMFHFAGCSDAKTFDQQAGIEGTLWMLIAALNGGNLVHDVGYIDNGLTSSLEMLVSMNEVAGLIKRFMGGIEVNDEMMAVDVIDQVGPGGHYLGEDHTYRHFRENWFPKLMDRSSYDNWLANGATTLGQRALEKALDILETHHPPSLSDDVRSRVAEILEHAEKRVQG
jgi:trimethylamine--corrinoid protein Co-methyltransferase